MNAPDKKSGESTSTAAPPKRMRQLLPVRLSSRWVGTVPADKTFAYSEAIGRASRTASIVSTSMPMR
jgi:hypothetical protein